MISGIVTAILLAAFLGIVVWAWSARNRERWQRAAATPLDDDVPLNSRRDDSGKMSGA
jgi:cytochrome c oxidase cbb3-type subunit IV